MKLIRDTVVSLCATGVEKNPRVAIKTRHYDNTPVKQTKCEDRKKGYLAKSISMAIKLS